MAKRN
jgi:small GTP-binding protein